jgi:hypothetical protein
MKQFLKLTVLVAMFAICTSFDSGNQCFDTAAERDAAAASWKKKQPFGVDTRIHCYDSYLVRVGWKYCFEWETCTP